MAQAIPKKSSDFFSIKLAIRSSGRIAGELLALSSVTLGLISTLLLVASLVP